MTERTKDKLTETRSITAIMPMAGRGSRFHGSRFVDEKGLPPKPLIDVAGQPMVWWALQSLRGITVAKMVFVVLEEHERQFGLKMRLQKLGSSFFIQEVPIEVVLQKGLVEGQLCSVMEAQEHITEDGGVLILSADTLVESDLGHHISTHGRACAGLISVVDLPGDQWSFARTDDTGRVVDVAEKNRISNNVSTGMYYFARGGDFLKAAEEIIEKQEKINGEYYVILTYRRLLQGAQHVEISRARNVAVWSDNELMASYRTFPPVGPEWPIGRIGEADTGKSYSQYRYKCSVSSMA